ncbi:MAG: glyoxalase superfamily protein [Rubripirellula sp.]
MSESGDSSGAEGITPGGFSLRSSIPVLRMLDENQSKRFYLEYLGFEVDWEHRFSEDLSSPLYMQIRQGDSILHLNGHAESDAPTTEVRIPVEGLERFCEHLCQITVGEEKPEVVDPRYEGRRTDMNLYDPSGNLIVFWATKLDD